MKFSYFLLLFHELLVQIQQTVQFLISRKWNTSNINKSLKSSLKYPCVAIFSSTVLWRNLHQACSFSQICWSLSGCNFFWKLKKKESLLLSFCVLMSHIVHTALKLKCLNHCFMPVSCKSQFSSVLVRDDDLLETSWNTNNQTNELSPLHSHSVCFKEGMLPEKFLQSVKKKLLLKRANRSSVALNPKDCWTKPQTAHTFILLTAFMAHVSFIPQTQKC